MKKILGLLGCFLLIFSVISADAEVKNPDTFILANYGNLRTLDPSVAYDVTSSQRLWNIYQTLVFFDGSHTDKFIPLVAARVPTLENGGISADGKTYTSRFVKGSSFMPAAI